MDGARWDRIQCIFHRAADLPKNEQSFFVSDACDGDTELMADVIAMLEEDARASLLDDTVAQVANGILGNTIPTPLREFGPYRIMRVLGEGGMGVVYLAERSDLGSLAAIKILRDAWLSPARRQRFAAEQRTLAKLNHPSIARLYDADTLPDGTPWFVMEYVEGSPLNQYCHEHGSPIEERLRLVRAVCEAVQYAHGHGVIHRDLKPSNILVKADGSLRLLDFGIAKQLQDAPIDQTRTGLRLLTPAYAAPEQVRGEATNVQTDIYSLGVILYELIAGRLPFDLSHKTAAEAAEIVVTQNPEKACGLSRDLKVMCQTAMHREPGRRYTSADALIRDIDHYLKQEPLEARADSAVYKLVKYLRRNWQVAAAAAVMLATILVSVAAAMNISTRGRATTSRARSVAVLPFQNLSGDPDLEFLRLGIAGELTGDLGYERPLTVRAFQFGVKSLPPSFDPANAGQGMRVGTVITGTFVKSNDRLRITVEAFDIAQNRVVWHDTIDAATQNLIALQSRIVTLVRGKLGPFLGATEFLSDFAAKPASEEAFDLYLRSQVVSADRGPNKNAIAMLEKTVELDSSYAPAWSALSSRYTSESWYNGGGDSFRERAVAAQERAMALDPTSVTNGASWIATWCERGDLAKIYQAAAELVRRRPDSPYVHFELAYVLRYAGVLDESERECDEANRLDSQDPGQRSCAVAFLLHGDNGRARYFLQVDGREEWDKPILMDILLREGKEQEAYDARPAETPPWAGYPVLNAYLERKPMREITAVTRELKPVHDPEMNYFSAAHLAYAGQTKAALAMLKETIDEGYCAYPSIESDPMFQSLRSRAEFDEIRQASMSCRSSFLARRGPAITK